MTKLLNWSWFRLKNAEEQWPK